MDLIAQDHESLISVRDAEIHFKENFLWMEILAFAKMRIFDGTPEHIATSFKISQSEAVQIINGLCLLGFLRWESGKVKFSGHSTIEKEVSLPTFKTLGSGALAMLDSEESSAYGLAVSVSNLALVKELINKCKDLELNWVKDSVKSEDDSLYNFVWFVNKKDFSGGHNA